MPFDDRRCVLSVTLAKETVSLIQQMLDPKNVLGTGCRVIKHPDCCIKCALNNDCSKLPMHPHCRCKPEAYLTAEAG